MAKNGVVNIHGKEYLTVAFRVNTFRSQHMDYSITTELVENTANRVVMKATIADASGHVLATGHAEEFRASSQINKTSALENCETSAIGRCLSACGYGGTEFASADEVQNAIHQQEASPEVMEVLEKAAKGGVESFRLQWKATSKADRDTLSEGQIAMLKDIADEAA